MSIAFAFLSGGNIAFGLRDKDITQLVIGGVCLVAAILWQYLREENT